MRFLVAVATPQTENKAPGLPIAVQLTELGLAGSVRIQDLWTHRDLGECKGEFSPVIAWHGAGLYRLSPLPAAK